MVKIQKLNFRVDCYCNAGFETDIDDMKSQTGNVFILNGSAVDWKSSMDSEIRFLKVHTDDNLADPFTKALPKGKLTQHARSMGLCLASSFIKKRRREKTRSDRIFGRRKSDFEIGGPEVEVMVGLMEFQRCVIGDNDEGESNGEMVWIALRVGKSLDSFSKSQEMSLRSKNIDLEMEWREIDCE
ncbi:hypothetical protein Tco_1202520 [Tanacetum coccineum]